MASVRDLSFITGGGRAGANGGRVIKCYVAKKWRVTENLSWALRRAIPFFVNIVVISVLAILSKILERHVHISFYNFLTENDLLSDSQFGFRKSCSCELAVTDLIDRLLNNMDNRFLNGLLLVNRKSDFL